MRRILFALLPLCFAAEAGAQIIRRPGDLRFGEPTAWATLGAALTQGWAVRDGATGSLWEFGDATQYAASLEKTWNGSATLGVRGTHARVPLRYTGGNTPGGPFATDADANVSQLLGTLHVSSGRELHSVLELSAGATWYYNFRARDSGAKLPPDSDSDFTFAFGYGVGYAFTPTFSVDVVQDLTTVVHQKTGLSAGEGSTSRINGTRLVARFGLGGR